MRERTPSSSSTTSIRAMWAKALGLCGPEPNAKPNGGRHTGKPRGHAEASGAAGQFRRVGVTILAGLNDVAELSRGGIGCPPHHFDRSTRIGVNAHSAFGKRGVYAPTCLLR